MEVTIASVLEAAVSGLAIEDRAALCRTGRCRTAEERVVKLQDTAGAEIRQKWGCHGNPADAFCSKSVTTKG